MADGKDMPAAIREIRMSYWKLGNPLGLVYSYYSYDGDAPQTQ
jgi:hypothetical protein